MEIHNADAESDCKEVTHMSDSILQNAGPSLLKAMVGLLGGEEERLVRISKAGDVIALTDRAAEVLDAKEGDCFYELLSEKGEQNVKKVVEGKSRETFSDNFGENVPFKVTAVSTKEGALVWMRPRAEQEMLDVKMQVDMRDSLQSLLGTLDRLEGQHPEENREMRLSVYRIQRMLTHAEMLRSAERRTKVRPREGDLAEVCRRSAEAFMAAGGPPVTVKAPKTMKAACDPSLLLRAILNLLTNAREAKQIKLTLTHRGKKPPMEYGNYLITVEDDGSGFEAEDLERIYYGWQNKANLSGVNPAVRGSIPGTGLPLVRQIAEGHDGELFYQPTEGGGSRFILSISDELLYGGDNVECWPEEEDTSIIRSELSVMGHAN